MAVGAAGCVHPQLRVDAGYEAPQTERHKGFFTGTAGAGVNVRNRHGQLGLGAEYAARPAANAVLFSVDGNLIVLRGRVRLVKQDHHTVTMRENSDVTLVSRASAGPALGDGRWVGEWSLGVGFLHVDHVDNRDLNKTYSYFLGGAIEVVATRTADNDHVDWMLGGRLSWTLPYSIIGSMIEHSRTRP
jgi:hypothetical protein